MNGTVADFVLDTNTLIDHARGIPGIEEFLNSRSPADRPAVHAVSAAEFLAGCKNKIELVAGRGLLRRFRLILPSSADFRHCLVLVQSGSLSHGVGWPDCLLAATCLRLQMPIVTLNVKHFKPIKGLKVVRPY